MSAGANVYVSEVADYEVRRELTRLVLSGQLPVPRLARLDQLAAVFSYLSVSTVMWKRAAELWADARRIGRPTASPAALDADVLIAALAIEIQATVVTCNPTHLGQWHDSDLAMNRIGDLRTAARMRVRVEHRFVPGRNKAA